MPRTETPALHHLIATEPAILPAGTGAPDGLDPEALVALYDHLYPRFEARLWQPGEGTEFDRRLELYQALFREQQALIGQAGQAHLQHRFIMAIPVADRPEHLRNCLESIYQLCRLYDYGGRDDRGRYAKVTVIVAEDSREQRHITAHRDLVEEYCDRGLQVIHFGQQEQYRLLQEIPAPQRQRLGRLLTTQPAERFYLKGQAANRNLSYLKMLQLTRADEPTLYYLVDSDQSFLVNRQTPAGEQFVPALNYLYYIDRIFRHDDIHILTGKLVGDPPVSPAVMAANFTTDVMAFLQQMARRDPTGTCDFHDHHRPLPGDAAYHDMAGLFGFQQQQTHFDYRCPLPRPHDHAACLASFADRLERFFYGEHPTRRTGFQYNGSFTELSPARTIYPGNYIVDFSGLKYIIPFGHLRLRMSGPTAGRLIQAEIGDHFASVNLPMLHRRTTADRSSSDFRPGVEQQQDTRIDISNEFERQFFGDLMLFSVVAWLKQHDLEQLTEAEALTPVVEQVEEDLLRRYRSKHLAINQRIAELERWVRQPEHWWHGTPALEKILDFLRNLESNFGDGSSAWQQIQSPGLRRRYRHQIIDALTSYHSERAAWDRLFT